MLGLPGLGKKGESTLRNPDSQGRQGRSATEVALRCLWWNDSKAGGVGVFMTVH